METSSYTTRPGLGSQGNKAVVKVMRGVQGNTREYWMVK